MQNGDEAQDEEISWGSLFQASLLACTVAHASLRCDHSHTLLQGIGPALEHFPYWVVQDIRTQQNRQGVGACSEPT